MSGFAEYDHYDAVGLADLVRKREASAAELLAEARHRCDLVNPRLNAVVHRLMQMPSGRQTLWIWIGLSPVCLFWSKTSAPRLRARR